MSENLPLFLRCLEGFSFSFFDELTDSVFEYIQLITVPIQELKFIKIGIDGYQNNSNLNNDLPYPEAVLFIQNKGVDEAKRLKKSLDKIRSLSVKGQIFKMKDYKKLSDACEKMTSQYSILQSFCVILGNPNLNWENPQVFAHLGILLSINPEDIENSLNENQIKYLEFVQNTYFTE